MVRNPDFLLREVAGRQVIVPVGNAVSGFPGMITVNQTGAFLWEQLAQEQTLDALVQAITNEYEVAQETAKQDVQSFLDKLRPTGALQF